MKVYALFHNMRYEGTFLLGVYQYLSQAQEAEYAYRLSEKIEDFVTHFTEIREITLGSSPEFECGSRVSI